MLIATNFNYNRNGFLLQKAVFMAGGSPPPDETFEFTSNAEDRLAAARTTVGASAGSPVELRYDASGNASRCAASIAAEGIVLAGSDDRFLEESDTLTQAGT